ncbi:MAG: dual specificity protein phosphatase family protein [Anaerolineae bacterium]|nr:dual specificity protein phosphatase family protein [Anaerolineae bacterium]
MIEVYPNLFVGTQTDYEDDVAHRTGWAVVHACKEPFHRRALGYKGRSVAKDHPEYLVARRGDELSLNIIDADDPAYFAPEMINAALDFIDESLDAGKRVLLHCNLGESRSPSIALFYLAMRRKALPTTSLEAAEVEFRKLYPKYLPKPGIRGYLLQHWNAG